MAAKKVASKAKASACIATLVALLALAAPAHGVGLSTTGLTYGSTFGGPKSLMVTSSGAFRYGAAPGSTWHRGLTVVGAGSPVNSGAGVGPATLAVAVDKCWARPNEVDHTIIRFVDAVGVMDLDVRVSCSGQSGCGACLGAATAVPTPRPTGQGTATSWPTATKTATARPTGTATASPNCALEPWLCPEKPTPVGTPNPLTYVQPHVQPIPARHLSIRRDEIKNAGRYTYCYIPAPNMQTTEVQYIGVPCTQKGRIQALFSSMTALVEVMRDASTRGLGQDIVDRWVDRSSGFGHVTGDLVTIYVANAVKLFKGGNGVWFSKYTGGFYQIEAYALRGLSNLYLKDFNRDACVAAPPAILELLDIRVENGECVRAYHPLPPIVRQAGDDRIERLGILQSERPLPMPSLRARELFHEASRNHRCNSYAKCGLPCVGDAAPVSARSVQAVLADLVAECSKMGEEMAAFCMVPQFAAGEDRRRPVKDRCLVALEEDRTWTNAGKAFDDLALGKLRFATWWFHWAVHFQTHVLMALYTEGQDVEMMYRFDCYGPDGTMLDNHECPLERESQVMARLRREYANDTRLRTAATVIDGRTGEVALAHHACSALEEGARP